RASRSAVSAVMPRFPRTISFKRLSEMPSRFAASSCPRPSGFKYSSSRISPGGIAGPSQSGSLVIVFDADFVGMSVLPAERDPVLLLDANAVASRLITLQKLEAIPRGNPRIFQAAGGVQHNQPPLHHAPQLIRDPSRGTSVPLAKQVNGGVVRERLNHTELHV